MGNRMQGKDWLEAAGLERLVSGVSEQYKLGVEERADLLQEVRIALWKHGLAELVGPAWIGRVTLYKAVDLVRRRARHRAHDCLLAYMQERTPTDHELGYLLHAMVDGLHQPLGAFYDLYYREGLSEREIAKRLCTCRASVRWLSQCFLRAMTGQGHSRRNAARLSARRRDRGRTVPGRIRR